MEKDKALELILYEYERALFIHSTGLRSNHEALAIIEEEYLEFRDAVFHGEDWEKRREAAQLGAMALRFLVDIASGQ